jgi:hypothetical protein
LIGAMLHQRTDEGVFRPQPEDFFIVLGGICASGAP